MNRRLLLQIGWNSSPCCEVDLTFWRVVRGYPLDRCNGCGSAYVNPRPTLEALKEYYACGGHGDGTLSAVGEVLEAEERYPNATIDARRILNKAESLAPGRNLLDVGCGYGFYAREASRLGFRVDALELSEFERSCTRQIANVRPEAVAFEEFRAEPASYHVILMSQILEHAVDPFEWIQKAGNLLIPGGLLILALPNFGSFLRLLLGGGDPYIRPPDHLNYFNARGLVRLLASGSFEVKSLTAVSRLPGRALTDRLPSLSGKVKHQLEWVLQLLQRPILWPLDILGVGMFLNVFAVKQPDV